MLPRSSDTDAFWQAFRRYAEVDHDNYIVASFGDSPDMATEREIGGLLPIAVISLDKRAVKGLS